MSKSGIQKRTPLPSKEASLFKELLTLYETKQLKKGLKTADQILKKFPEHGETLCMKGLVLTHMGRRDEGIDLVKKGIKLDLMSHICWHVFGLIQKGDRNYDEALKSYTQALRFDKENMNLLRDSAQLQTHLRLFDNLVETRHTIIRLRANQRQNWIALAVAHHLNKNPKETKLILEHYFHTLKNVNDYDTEHSETLLYYIHVLEELEQFEDALSFLNQNAKARVIVDRTSILEIRARLLSKLKSPDAEEAWCALIQHNPDSYDSYRGYLENEGLSVEVPSPEAIAKLDKFLQIPGATAPRRLQLGLAFGDQFTQLVKPYIIRGLEKGVPSLFADLKSLYVHKEKQTVIENIVESLREEYAETTDTSRNKELDPTTYLWTLYFLAQHYSHLSRQSKALEILDTAIEHTPTLPELYMLRGKVLKRAGDYFGAAKFVNEARILDGQDRFLNTKCGKYLLRADMLDEAIPVFGLFTKKDASGPAADLQDMQSLLFLLEAADSHRRSGKLNLALKKYMAIKSVFDEFENDQFDFHGYILRKCTLNIYLQLLKWEEQLYSHPVYVRAVIEASRIFVQVADTPNLVTSLLSSSTQLTDAEKKAKKKAKKAEKKREEVEKKAQAPQQSNADKDLDNQSKKDDDPDGFKLLGCPDPLEQASKLLRTLTNTTTTSIDVWIASYDVSIRRNKLLQAIKALNNASAINPDHPDLHVRIVDIKLRSPALLLSQSPIGPVFVESLGTLLPDSISLETFNSQYLQRHHSDANSLLAVARVMQMLQSPLSEIEDTIFSIFDVDVDLKTAMTAVDQLESVGQSGRVEELKSACQTKFPLSTVFKRSEEIVQLRRKVLERDDEKEGDIEGSET